MADYRTKNFVNKFSSAQKYLGADSIQNLVSLKYRDNVERSDYQQFVAELSKPETNWTVREVVGDFQGHAWLVEDKYQNAVILVEHETGLEILYIASSIASFISLIPMINSGWKYLRGRFGRHPRFYDDRMTRIEIRTINPKGQLLEKHIVSVEDYVLEESIKEIVALKAKVKHLEKEIAKINKSKKVQVKKLKDPIKKRTK